MKKILALLLASLLLIGLFAGCAKQETAPVQQEQTTTTEPAPAEQPAEQPSEQPENTGRPTAPRRTYTRTLAVPHFQPSR